MEIIRAGMQEADRAAALAQLLWPGHAQAELEQERRGRGLCAVRPAARLCGGNAHQPGGVSGRRVCAKGTHTSPVGYLEGVFVQEEYRGRGVATALLRACEAWAGEKGCAEFASDCGLDNAASAVFHLRAGFAEAGRIICFTKRL